MPIDPRARHAARRLAQFHLVQISQLARAAAACAAAAFAFTAAHAGETAEPPDICPALKTIVASSDYAHLRSEPAAKLPGVDAADDCHTSAHVLDCRWHAHWKADGFVNDPLEELGADVAACLPNVVHDVNTPTRQHFIVKAADRRVNVTASVVGQDELRLRVTR
ncbi:hypothetical protein FAZ69_11290 [Trinickia terrae]|uniref:Secreted protein n=1 Tax=Trinickia terrae TaxID=2571161 RepID=A0A4U1I7U6_9BURK|nr:hypothetical protein [Trinickia terrae]TKC89504.1 hypothetical protein FAZ69_11290 [Trinickia terrae]